MPTLLFPESKMAPAEDPTDRAWQDVAMACRALEQAAATATTHERCRQLHERALACLQILVQTQGVISQRWDAVLRKSWER